MLSLTLLTTLEIPAKGHTNGKPVIENQVEATVSAEGHYEEVIYCSECKVVIVLIIIISTITVIKISNNILFKSFSE